MNEISAFVHIELNLRMIITLIHGSQQCSLSISRITLEVVFFHLKEVVLMLIKLHHESFLINPHQ